MDAAGDRCMAVTVIQYFIVIENSFKNGRKHLDSFESWVALKKAVWSSNVFVQQLIKSLRWNKMKEKVVVFILEKAIR